MGFQAANCSAKCWWEKDLSPLVECTALEDLNLGWSYPNPEPISHMPLAQAYLLVQSEAHIRYPVQTGGFLRICEQSSDTL